MHELVHTKLAAYARARLRSLESRQRRLKNRLGGGSVRRLVQSIGPRVSHAELELVQTAAAQCGRFVREERWRVALHGAVLNLNDGALLTRAQRKVPLLKTIETSHGPSPAP